MARGAEKLRGTNIWVSTAGWVLVWEGVAPSAVRVRGYHHQEIFENSDAKSCILVTSMLISGLPRCEISCFLKPMAKNLGDQYIVGPPT